MNFRELRQSADLTNYCGDLPSTHLLWTLVKSETADRARFSYLDVCVTAHAVDSRWQLAHADYVLTRLG